MQDSNSSDIDRAPQRAMEEASAAVAKRQAEGITTQNPSSQDSQSGRKSNRQPISLGLSLFLSIGLVAFAMLGLSVFIQVVQAVQQKILNPAPIPSFTPAQLKTPAAEPLNGSVLKAPAAASTKDLSSETSPQSQDVSIPDEPATEATIDASTHPTSSAPVDSSKSDSIPLENEEAPTTPANSPPVADSTDEAQLN